MTVTLGAPALLLLSMIADCAQAQSSPSDVVPYCSDLKRVVALAATQEHFAPIAGEPREGNFRNTTLSLTGWKDCSLYGTVTYTCDSQELETAEAAEQTQAGTLRDIKSCLGETWTEASDRSSPSYVVLHRRAVPLSITLSTDRTDLKEHVVRLILFVRRN